MQETQQTKPGITSQNLPPPTSDIRTFKSNSLAFLRLARPKNNIHPSI